MKKINPYNLPVFYVIFLALISCHSVPTVSNSPVFTSSVNNISYFESFQDNRSYHSQFEGIWRREEQSQTSYFLYEFKNDNSGFRNYYENNKLLDREPFRYKTSDYQLVITYIQMKHTFRVNYDFSDNDDTMSWVNDSDGDPSRIYYRVGNASTTGKNIEEALSRAAGDALKTVPKNSRIAIVFITAQDRSTTEYIVGELEFIWVNAGFTIVDRSDLDRIRREQNLQMSGEVDDETAVSIGKFIGANIIVTGRVDGEGNLRRLRLRALDTQSTQVIGVASERI